MELLFKKHLLLEKYLKRINEDYINFETFKTNLTHQDAVLLNLQKSIVCTITMAMFIVQTKHLGLPQSSRDVFSLLAKAQLISEELSTKMQNLVGFLNIAKHNYTSLNLEIIKSIIEHNLNDMLHFAKIIIKI